MCQSQRHGQDISTIPAHIFGVGCVLRISDLCTGLFVLTQRVRKQDPSYRILMPEKQCTWWFVLHMRPHWLFIAVANYEKRLYPSTNCNDFLHRLYPGSRHSTKMAYFVTAQQDWSEKEADGIAAKVVAVTGIRCHWWPFSQTTAHSTTLMGKYWINDGPLSQGGKD